MAMGRSGQTVVFELQAQRFALPLRCVEHVVRAVEVTPLPKAPPIVTGVIDVHGAVVPVFDLRRRFRMPGKPMDLADHIIIARTARGPAALPVDAVLGVSEWSADEAVPAESIVPGIAYVDGVVKRPDGMVFIHDIDAFLSLDEATQLEDALRRV